MNVRAEHSEPRGLTSSSRRQTAAGPAGPLGRRRHRPSRLGGRRHRLLTPHLIAERLRRSRLRRRAGAAPDPAGHGSQPEEGYEVVVRTAAPIGANSPLPARVATVVGSPAGTPEVKSVLDYANTGDPTMISKTGNLTVVVATVGAVQEKQAVTALQSAIAAQPSLKGNTWLGGPTVADVQIAAVSSQDLGRAELFALPFLLLLLFFVFRGLRAAAVPLVGAVFAIAVTLGVMGLVMVAVPLSVFALNLVIALGLGLSVDFSLLIVSRFREEFRRQGSIEAALAHRPADRRAHRAFQLDHDRGGHGHARHLPRALRLLDGDRRCDRRPGGWCLRSVRPAVAPGRVRGAHRRTPLTAAAPPRRPDALRRAAVGTGSPPSSCAGPSSGPQSARPGPGGPRRTVPPRLVHRCRCERPADQQLRRHRLPAGPVQVRRLLRGAGRPCGRCRAR